MTYMQDSCLPGDYYECSGTSVAESEPEKGQGESPSLDSSLDTSSYKKPLSESNKEELPTFDDSFDTSHYKKSSVRKRTYRVIKK